MKPLAAAALLAASLSAAPVSASVELARKYACMACHAVDKKMVGPSYQDIAKKYAGQKDAAAQLADSIRKGGVGKWGPIPMPAQPAPTDAEMRALAEWVLGGGK